MFVESLANLILLQLCGRVLRVCRYVCVCIYEYMWSRKENQACIRHGIFVLLEEDIRRLSLEVLQKRLNWVCKKKRQV